MVPTDPYALANMMDLVSCRHGVAAACCAWHDGETQTSTSYPLPPVNKTLWSCAGTPASTCCFGTSTSSIALCFAHLPARRHEGWLDPTKSMEILGVAISDCSSGGCCSHGDRSSSSSSSSSRRRRRSKHKVGNRLTAASPRSIVHCTGMHAAKQRSCD